MYVGADYYPEHWEPDRWETDARLMQEAGFNVVRLAEFAWAYMEPEEGRYEFGWLDDALGVLADHGVAAILCTPTATMPAWVKRKYPEVMAMKKDGRRIRWGVRKNNCFTSGTYRLLSERITRAMAEHFAGTSGLIGWQTDNELGGPVCCCGSCRAGFQDWLRRRYGTLEEVNRRWGTHFWGQQYRTWGEIELPADQRTYNPSLCLDARRYHSDLNVQFQRDQVKILRQVCPDHFITHNLMGLYRGLNYYDLAEDLDHVSWDNYPVWAALLGEREMPIRSSAAADLMRGLKRRNFWIMEQTAGPCGWGTFGRNPRPGEIRKIAYQQLAHGCDGQVWFRWRTCTAGREQYWHGLLGHDGKPLRRYQEAARTAGEYHRLADELEGTTVEADVAIIYDYESLWALDIQPGFEGNDYVAAMLRYYGALARAGVNVDMVRPTEDLSGYKAVIAPELHVLPDAAAESLNEFVAAGGVLLTDLRTGVKDETNLCHQRTLPGLLGESLGIVIEEYGALGPEMEYGVVGAGGLEGTYTATGCVDWVRAASADVLATYDQGHLEGFAAVTCNRHGKGAAYYVGTVVKEPEFYDALIALVLQSAGVKPILAAPPGVEVSVRKGGGKELLFLVNHTEQEVAVEVPAGRPELLSGETTGETLELGKYAVAVVKLA
ncbi:MAG: beta-galactosidase [Planctomycetota bacterium]|jgi:beta-galactosidase